MLRRVALLAATALLIAPSGCEIIDHGGDLPPDRAAADQRFHDPWHGIDHPLLDQEMQREVQRR
jgi:hypothetical protein